MPRRDEDGGGGERRPIPPGCHRVSDFPQEERAIPDVRWDRSCQPCCRRLKKDGGRRIPYAHYDTP